MAGETSAQAALTRLEAAFDRVEAATARLTAGDGAAAVAARHRKLQQEVETALASLDRLLAASEAQ